MNKVITLFALLLVFKIQAQELKFQSGDVGFNKGVIDQELLLDLVQKKQQEVKKDVFFNLVVGNFKKLSNDNAPLNNFTTYYYIYNVFDELTAGKSKKAMTQSLLKKSLDFSYVYAFAWHSFISDNGQHLAAIKNNTKKNESKAELDSIFSSVKNGDLSISKVAEITFAKSTILQSKTEIKKKPGLQTIEGFGSIDLVWSDYLDVAFEILAIDKKNPSYEFENDSNDVEFMRWYKTESNYRYALAVDTHRRAIMTDLKNRMDSYYSSFDSNVTNISALLEGLKNCKMTYSKITSKGISREQLDAIKYVLTTLAKRSELRYSSNIVSTIVNMITENTFYQDSVKDAAGNVTEDGYVYVDVQSVISRTYSEFEKIAEKKSFFRYIMPVVDIGVNYGYFQSKKTDISFNNTKMSNLYYVSEKLGIRYKIWNWKYTHGVKAGQNFSYYGKNRYWITQQKRPTISDIHISTYVSGFLYQIRELKSEKQFDYFLWGNSVGITFFNSLIAHVGFAVPFNNYGFKKSNIFLNAGFDLPLSEYINALAKKVSSK